MKPLIAYIFILISAFSFAQEIDEEQALVVQKANNYVAEANDFIQDDDFILAEKEYRKAISVKPTSVSGTYNLAHSYYKKENFEEALYRNQEAAKNAITKIEKFKIYHNTGNILMQKKKCKEAVEAFKHALRNNPKDEETRYNLALAKECAKNEKEDPQEEDKDGENKKDKQQEKDKEDKENEDEKEEEDKGNDKEDEKDKGDNDKKEGEDKPEEDKGKPKDEKKDEGKEGNDDKKQQPQQQPGQLSPQQIKNLLEAMNNQEQKVQEKINAKKVKGAKIQTDKDW